MGFLATINTPGYLPWNDDPPVFETAREAWDYLADEYVYLEDHAEDIEELIVERDVSPLIEHADEPGTVYMVTPGHHNNPHDLGLAFCVTEVEEED